MSFINFFKLFRVSETVSILAVSNGLIEFSLNLFLWCLQANSRWYQIVELEITVNMLGAEQCCCNLGWEALFRGKPLRTDNCSPTLILSPILPQTWSAADWEKDHVFSGWHDILGRVQMKYDWERKGNSSENERWKRYKSRVGIDLKGLKRGEVMNVSL